MKEIAYQSFEELLVVMMVPEMANVLRIGLTKAYKISKEKGFPCMRLGMPYSDSQRSLYPLDQQKTSQSSVLL